jgi:hypothetical protein
VLAATSVNLRTHADRVEQAKRLECDACREQAPYAIGVVDEFERLGAALGV